MTTPSDDASGPELLPVPVRVVLPADPVLGQPQQEVVARLWGRRQTESGWLYLVGLPSYRDREDGGVEAAEYRVWVRAPEHVRQVDGVDYDQVVTERLKPPQRSVVHEVLGERRPWCSRSWATVAARPAGCCTRRRRRGRLVASGHRAIGVRNTPASAGRKPAGPWRV
ncbi:hypothetical protein [Streptomyces sp. NPDC006355]|uniref:hypothetical protein n=1 Tax=Streptomyces sp. NPDC006355 TaxID=3156758 RepID=UPI0033B1E20D